MKPNELRIGNIIKLRDTGEIVRVCGLTKRKIGFHAPNERPNAQLRYRKYSEIEPVLIFDHWRKIDCPYLEWRDVWGDGKWYKYKIWNMSIYKTIRYLHELQNIHYALSGEELEIEL